MEHISEAIPTADAEAIVRCGNCANKKLCYIWGLYLDDEDYCSYGVKEDASNIVL